ncbi:TetR family transcriptional regulator [Nocardioides litoris]|uniref:TetR family transcriptional regulator n=1 Tax=Nocardioides litoris TaxID=1926648 RepID=UPI00111F8E27|nr:TetR family transcriptional regulator [Nocardioides litoris]
MTEATETRVERKERTRRAILDATLELCEESSLVALSLRQVAKQVGIVPTAFYRHFDSIESLGLALVDESFVSLRAMLRDVRRPGRPGREEPSFRDIVDRSVDTLVSHVQKERQHFNFIVRERAAGPLSVRAAIRHQVELCERELATDIARLPGTEEWSNEDLHVLSNLIVTAMVATAEDILVAAGRPDLERAVGERARQQLRMVLIGAFSWRSH